MASSYHTRHLAQDRGDYDEAARQYRRSLDIKERLGNQAGMAPATTSSASSPRTAGTTTRPPASTGARAGTSWQRLGHQAGGMGRPPVPGVERGTTSSAWLAQARGDYDEAARQYQRSLDINERLGNQAGMATSYHQLGSLAQDRGDYDEAARQYRRSLDIKLSDRRPPL